MTGEKKESYGLGKLRACKDCEHCEHERKLCTRTEMQRDIREANPDGRCPHFSLYCTFDSYEGVWLGSGAQVVPPPETEG